MSRQNPQLDALTTIFLQKTPDGRSRYTNEEVRAFVPLMALASGAPFEELPETLQTALMELCARAGLRPEMEDEQTASALATYYEAHPLNADLAAEFLEFVRRSLAPDFDADPRTLARGMGQALKGESSTRAAVVQKNVFDAEPE